MTTVTRRYSIKRLLRDLPRYEELRLLAELARAWDVDAITVNRKINLIQGRSKELTASQVERAAEVLGVSMKEIMIPYQEETSRPVKV